MEEKEDGRNPSRTLPKQNFRETIQEIASSGGPQQGWHAQQNISESETLQSKTGR